MSIKTNTLAALIALSKNLQRLIDSDLSCPTYDVSEELREVAHGLIRLANLIDDE